MLACIVLPAGLAPSLPKCLLGVVKLVRRVFCFAFQFLRSPVRLAAGLARVRFLTAGRLIAGVYGHERQEQAGDTQNWHRYL